MGLGNLDLERRIKAGEPLSREEALSVWEDVRQGVRKQFPHGAMPNNYSFLRDEQHRHWILQEFISDYLRDEGRYPEQSDYEHAKLAGLLGKYFNYSPHNAAVFAGFTNPENITYYDVVLDKMPWLAIRLPQNFWQIKENRAKAVRWAVRFLRKQGKSLAEIGWNEVAELVGPIRTAQKERITLPELLAEAGYDLNIVELRKVPNGTWQDQKTRIAYMLRRTAELGRPPGSREVSPALLKCSGGYHNLLDEAGLLTKTSEK